LRGSDAGGAPAPGEADAKSGPVADPAPQSDPSPTADSKTPAASVSVPSAAPAPTDAPAAAASRPASIAPGDGVPVPLDKPAALAKDVPERHTPISVFISRKEKRLYVRQNFEPLFDTPVTIERPEQPLGTHVFTALGFLGDDHAAFRWNVVTLPTESPKAARHVDDDDGYQRRAGRRRHEEEAVKPAVAPPAPQTPAEALARIGIPQDVIDHISEMMVPGSSLIVSDHGLGGETGEGTDFIVVTR
jgi:hypothetical protein